MRHYKALYSIVGGILGFILAPYGVEVQWENVIINIPWALFFPVLVSLAYGWKYAILTALAGGVLFPFYLWHDNGWPNLGTALVYLLYMVIAGLFSHPKLIKKVPNNYYRLFLLQIPGILLLFIYYYVIFGKLIALNPPFWNPNTINSMDELIYRGFFIKDTTNFIALYFIAFTLIELPIGKKLLKLNCDECNPQNQFVFFFSILVAWGVWFIFLLLSDALISDISVTHDEHIELAFMVMSTSGFIVGHVLYVFFNRLFIVQQELKASEEKYRFLSENAAVGVSLIEHDQVKYISQGYLRMLGYDENEIININLQQIYGLIHPEDLPFIQSELLKSKEQKLKHYSYSYRVKAKNNSYFWVEDTVTSEYDEAGNRTRSIIHSHNITEKKEADLLINMQYNELKKLNADKSRFMQILAHDLRSPFNSLIGFSELLVKNIDTYNIDKIKKHAEIINDISHRSFNLLNDLLLWSQAQSGKLSFEPKNLNLHEIITSILDEFCIQIDAKSLHVHNHISPNSTIYADEPMLKTIIRNLLSNAIKFTPAEGEISFSCEKLNGFVHLYIKDTGIGISEENIAKLWDMTQFFTSMGTEGEKGTGLGLMLCKEFTDKHGGDMKVESIQGQGSTFSFSLPESKTTILAN